MPPRQNTLNRSIAKAVSALIASVILLSGQTAVAAPQYNMEERASAIAGPSLVYLEMNAKGFLRRKDNGEALHPSAIGFTYRCSGFVVTNAGHVISSTRCVSPEPDSLRSSAIGQVVAERVRTGAVAADQREAVTKDLAAISEFTGDKPGSKPEIRVFGQLFQGQAGLTTEPAMPAEVVTSDPAAESDVTLLKLTQGALPTAELSQTPITPGSPVVIIGYATESGSSTYMPRSKQARVVGRVGTKTPATYRLDGDLGGPSQGGLVVDSGGRVVGMIDTDLAGKDKLNKLVTNYSHIGAILTKANVSNSLSPMDTDYRAGLNAYFGGRYTEAIEEFDRVLSVLPDHGTAKAYRAQAADRFAIEGDSSSSNLPLWLVIVLAVLVAALMVSLATIVWLLGKLRSRQAYFGTPVSALPVSAYPVSGSPIHTSPPPYDYRPALPGEPSGPPITGGSEQTQRGWPNT